LERGGRLDIDELLEVKDDVVEVVLNDELGDVFEIVADVVQSVDVGSDVALVCK
jgi:hypothetical protein